MGSVESDLRTDGKIVGCGHENANARARNRNAERKAGFCYPSNQGVSGVVGVGRRCERFDVAKAGAA
jgi:hypothetical protein